MLVWTPGNLLTVRRGDTGRVFQIKSRANPMAQPGWY